MRARLVLFGLALIVLISGVASGIARLGVAIPAPIASLASVHGPLMICAFFGTVIGLERAVAVSRSWAYAAPAASVLGGVALLSGVPPQWAAALFVCAGLVLVGVSVVVIRRHFALHTGVLLLGAVCWLIGSLAWFHRSGGMIPVAAWLAFLVITIAGERLELTRLLPRKRAAAPLFLVAVSVVVAGALWALHTPYAGGALFGLGLVALALWLVRYDIARHNVRQRGLTRFIAIALLSGYGWLAVGGILFVLAAGQAWPWQDAILHSLGLGFVVAMVFGHAPIILPAVAGIRIAYHPVLYLPLVMLHLSLAARVFSSGAGLEQVHRLAGVANALSLVVFAIVLVSRASRGVRAAPRKVG